MDVWICIPRIIAADTITTATVAVAIMIKGLVLSCIALSIPSPIIKYPITITVKSVATVLSITATPNAVTPISAPPTIRRVVVNFDLFFPRISIPNARKNKIIDDIPKLDIRNGFLSIFAGKNPCLLNRSMDPSAIWISNKIIAAIAKNSDIRTLRVFIWMCVKLIMSSSKSCNKNQI